MIKPILQYPNPVLNQISKDVTEFNDDLKLLFRDMRDTLVAAKGVGISAIQIGIPIRACTIVYVNGMTNKPEFLDMCNPVIIDKSKETEFVKTGCLSCPRLFVPMHASSDVTVKFLNPTQKECTYSLEGILARCQEHELNHLNGKLIIDFIPAFKRSETLKKWKKRE